MGGVRYRAHYIADKGSVHTKFTGIFGNFFFHLRYLSPSKTITGLFVNFPFKKIICNWCSISSSPSPPPPGVSAVSSESCCSRKSSIARDFSFSSLSNFQVSNHITSTTLGWSLLFQCLQFSFQRWGEVVEWADLALHNNPKLFSGECNKFKLDFTKSPAGEQEQEQRKLSVQN